ncbi:hypothetical protein Ga0100231_023315 [Opitutaceae bacterium TAV4]|nr:hypothetical protein Ga0100231_023315 [Opitutaceae bacterium TAV4]RRK02427.1 hypothetical protein Ga0100230_004590 [Opitutaceae bacterium TAV3]
MAAITLSAYTRNLLGLPTDKTLWTQAQKDQYLAKYAELRQQPAPVGVVVEPDANAAVSDVYAAWSHVEDQNAHDFNLWDATTNALAESVSELPGRINTAIDTVGKGILGSIPVWLRWVIGGAIVAYVFVLIRPYLPTPAPAPTPKKKAK